MDDDGSVKGTRRALGIRKKCAFMLVGGIGNDRGEAVELDATKNIFWTWAHHLTYCSS